MFLRLRAFRTYPVLRQLIKWRPRRDVRLRISLHRIILVAAAVADHYLVIRLFLFRSRSSDFLHRRRRFFLPGIKSRRQKRKDFIDIADDPVITVFKNRRIRIDVDRDDRPRVDDSLQMLHPLQVAAHICREEYDHTHLGDLCRLKRKSKV